MKHTAITVDGNEAAASVAYRLSEAIALYPITPSTPMGESSDEWSAKGKKNLWGNTPAVVEMQSEAGVAGAIHGILQAGTLATTFTASQGLLLMIPAMYKIAGELSPFVLHVTARALATNSLSIFGDHSDVMAVRQTGFAMLNSANVQEAQDLACIAHLATLQTRVPFLHFFDGFRTSHEINQIDYLTDDMLRRLLDPKLLNNFYQNALTPDRPTIRGTTQNPDVYFQTREAGNPFYLGTPAAVQQIMDDFAKVTGRQYHLFDYTGHPQAEQVIVVLGSGGETSIDTVNHLNADGGRFGVLQVRLFRPFDVNLFVRALPPTVQKIAVLDRTKEPGSAGEPLYQDVVTALHEVADAPQAQVCGGRYGIGSKEFTPAMVKAIFDELQKAAPRRHFTVGIIDDVTGTSLTVDDDYDIEPSENKRAVFFGLGSDGTVGANKNTIKIIGDETEFKPQAYFVYDSKKSGAMTISHLRFGPRRINSPYLIKQANFVGVHQWQFVEKCDFAAYAAKGATLLLNSPFTVYKIWDHLPLELQAAILEKKLRVYAIDAYRVARETGMGSRTNTIMQTCFFAISGVLPREEAIAQIKKSIEKTYLRKGQAVVEKNWKAVDQTLANLHEIIVPEQVTSTHRRPAAIPAEAPAFMHRVTALMMEGKGDLLPVSAFPVDGVWPTDTARWEKRNLSQMIPVWAPELCIQCNKCMLGCPHATIRGKFYPDAALQDAPATFKHTAFKSRENPGCQFTIQIAPEDCTGCGLCIAVCPGKDKNDPKRKALTMMPQEPIVDAERVNWNYYLGLPLPDRAKLKTDLVKDSQFLQPLFEFSGACAGCGETPYVKLISQLYGDRALIANATGCSSIYGGNLPVTPYAKNADGRGPAWANSLFEDNAEFGLGLRMGVDQKNDRARYLLASLSAALGDQLAGELLNADQSTEAGLAAQRQRVVELRDRLRTLTVPEASELNLIADYLVKKSVWIVGGDGWAYDIGYGGLDHVISLGKKVNILVLDTEVYSNTGGQQSKSTPMGAVAKFAVNGKAQTKKDLGLLAMSYGSAYVARIAFGAKDSQTVKALHEADNFPGTALIIAYSHCIAHGINMETGLNQQKLAVDSGYWPLYRFDPRRLDAGQSPLILDSAEPKTPLEQFMANETRFKALKQINPERYQKLETTAQEQIRQKYAQIKGLETNWKAQLTPAANGTGAPS
ncbi:MAG: pyruvate:ferredoxin (flavodoxin) oxidoreductase [Verrucomicrobiales bacterium]|jgi:pyruvate-ferredoxin/flavodoxin oxidoreductase|nr:pyruvate:ferredoxin (flavodoxin) oxidoreductase [Verrucomicrobiales bacterium]